MGETAFAVMVLVGLAGTAFGAVVGWIAAASRTRILLANERADLERRVAEDIGTIAELRVQLKSNEGTLGHLRERLDREQEARAVIETRLEESVKGLAKDRRLIEDAEERFKNSFETLSQKALHASGEQFLSAAKKTMEVMLSEARGDFGKRQDAISSLVAPLSDSLKRYEDQVHAMEHARQRAYGSLEEQVKMLATSSQQLQQETGKLVSSLRDPKVRGRWGEIALKRAAELAGMSDHCDFDEQVTLSGVDGIVRPDMVVRLPGDRTVVIDAKAVVDAYLDAVAATDETTRQACLLRHATQIRARIKELSSKAYWDRLGSTPEFVVLFLPAESFFSAAVEVDRTLIEDAIERRVVLASPTTLIALLRAIAYGWRQQQIIENAEHISMLGRDVFGRMRVLAEHVNKIGTSLQAAVRSFNAAVGSLESRVLPAARRFKELGAGTGDDLPELARVDLRPATIDPSQIELL